MKVVIDDKIPFIREAALRLFGNVLFLPGASITAKDVKDADALIVRTRTRCNRALLEGSKVQFIVTATIGFDHLDTSYLKEAGIEWTNCPGCNAASVGQYVESTLLLLKRKGLLDSSKTLFGIVGLGHVGTQVAAKVTGLGCTILACDPPRQEMGEGPFHSLAELAEKCQVISFHTPLTRKGAHPTFHLADSSFFQSLKQRPAIINAARGGVVDEQALLAALDKNKVRAAIIDTWEHEPNINLDLLHRTFLGTPHIAGYSADGKANATRMSLHAVCTHFHLNPDFHISPPCLPSNLIAADNSEERKLQLYNPMNDSHALLVHPECFEQLRGNYPLRREVWDQECADK